MPTAQPSIDCWTCARCAVIARSMTAGERPDLPATWVNDAGNVFCLACRRELAAEEGVDDAPEDATRQDRAKLRSRALVEFEVDRDPDRPNMVIARAARSSVPAVQDARRRLGVDPVGG